MHLSTEFEYLYILYYNHLNIDKYLTTKIIKMIKDRNNFEFLCMFFGQRYFALKSRKEYHTVYFQKWDSANGNWPEYILSNSLYCVLNKTINEIILE